MNTNITKEIRTKINEAHRALFDARLIALDNNDLDLYLKLCKIDEPVEKMWDELHFIDRTEEVGA